jgi:hypothetical protein
MSHSRDDSASSRSSFDSARSQASFETDLTTPFSSPPRSKRQAASGREEAEDSDSELPTPSSSSRSAIEDDVQLGRLANLLAPSTRQSSPAPRPPCRPEWFANAPADVLVDGSDEEARRLKQLEKQEPLLQASDDRFVLFPIKFPQVSSPAGARSWV